MTTSAETCDAGVLPTAAELAGVRALQQSMLPNTCSIHRKATADDGAGGRAQSWSEVLASAPCRLGAMTAREQVAAAQLGQVVTHALTLAHGVDIRLSDRVVCGGITYDIVSRVSGGDFETATRLLIVRAR